MGFKIWLISLISVLISESALAQQTHAKPDSTHLYKNIESYSKRSKFTKFAYSLIFKPIAHRSIKRKHGKRINKKLIQKRYSAFEGKTIRFINIETLDPFGYSIADTGVTPHGLLSKTGNSLHLKSQSITIRNLLLIHQNQIFDSLLVKESERLVRSRVYVVDVSFFVKATSKNSDSVDIFIRELDNWSIIPKVEAPSSGVLINLTDLNFLGLGHVFQNDFTRNYSKGTNAFHTNYSIPNIRNTYISATLHYGIDGYNNSSKSLGIDRPFFSPFAKWAAGMLISKQFRKDSMYYPKPEYMPVRFNYNTLDFWAGNAWQIHKGNTEYDRTTNFISTARFLSIRYLEKPNEMLDSLQNYANENFYLGSIGVSSRKYVQDKFIFNYGVTEDVPIGSVYGLTGGYQERNNIDRLYLGARISLGNYYPWGYLSSNFEYGTFIHKSHTEQGVITAGANYFTDLIEIGKWKFRQFVKPQIAIGLNRFSYDSLTLKDGVGIDGFNSAALSGNKRLLLTLQTQSYTPWNFLGFHFGPYFICSLGMLGDDIKGFKNSKVYSQIGLGVLIKNYNLIINTFQFSFSFYPLIPGVGEDVFKMNSFKTTDFGFRDFVIGKPETIIFQ